MRLLITAGLAAVLCVGCESDKAFVANSVAQQTYHQVRYTWQCVETKKEEQESCKQFKQLGNSYTQQVDLANVVQQKGRLPKMEKKEMKKTLKKIEALP